MKFLLDNKTSKKSIAFFEKYLITKNNAFGIKNLGLMRSIYKIKWLSINENFKRYIIFKLKTWCLYLVINDNTNIDLTHYTIQDIHITT